MSDAMNAIQLSDIGPDGFICQHLMSPTLVGNVGRTGIKKPLCSR